MGFWNTIRKWSGLEEVNGGSSQLNQMQDLANQQYADYKQYGADWLDYIKKNNPSIDLRPYSKESQANQKLVDNRIASTSQEYADKINAIPGQYNRTAQAYSDNLYDTVDQGASDMLSIYNDLANQKEMPGQNVAQQKMDRNMASGVSSVKNMGRGGGLNAITAMVSNANQTQQDYAGEYANWKATMKQNLAQANMNAARARADAMGQGYQAVSGEEALLSNMRMNSAMASSDVMNQANLNRYSIAQQGNQERMGMHQQQFNINELMPYESMQNYYATMTGQTQNAATNALSALGDQASYEMYQENQRMAGVGRWVNPFK